MKIKIVMALFWIALRLSRRFTLEHLRKELIRFRELALSDGETLKAESYVDFIEKVERRLGFQHAPRAKRPFVL